MEAIAVEGLVKRYGHVEAVNGVSFTVHLGEVFGFLGPNGAGKTTTINILCTLLLPTAGQARVNGFNVVKQRSQVRQSIGLVFQDPSLDEYLTAWENLKFHAMAYAVPQAKERIEQVLHMVGLWERRHSLVRTFSGGMKRRLEICRGLLHFPKVLFLDEPTLGLDPQTRESIWAYILEMRHTEATTIFLTTHYMDEAEHCDRIAIIDQGRIIALDTPEALKTQVGGDIITLETGDNEASVRELQQRYGIQAQARKGLIYLEVARGSQFIPELVRNFDQDIRAVSLRRPTLDDVFIKLTGRAIREEEAGGKEQMRQHARMWRSRH
ncbi:MAG: ATP-binding cassette domain-containing protein [Chloroflexota bacterium]